MALLEFKVSGTKRTELTPGNEILNIDLKISYAEFLSMTKHLVKPYRARFELPDGNTFEANVGFAKGAEAAADARITMRNFKGEVPAGTMVHLLE
ncbi:MAG: hypothetical protein IT463_12370 [Planctomycetes bacterium]|nr:hypothetical protein [Planctomycetota bacterium]